MVNFRELSIEVIFHTHNHKANSIRTASQFIYRFVLSLGMEHSLKVLFWNFKILKRPTRKQGNVIAERKDVILSLLNQYKPDLILFAEGDEALMSDVESYTEIDLQSQKHIPVYRLFSIPDSKIFLYYRSYLDSLISAKYFDSKLQNRLVYLYIKHYELFFIGLHLIDPRNHTVEDRLIHAIRVRRKIEQQKTKLAQSIQAFRNRTFIIGDFNMNPYDRGMTALDAFSSVPTEAHLKAKDSKASLGKSFKKDYFLINQCWTQLSDTITPGSHIYDNSFELLSWRLIDQCLCSLDLHPYLKPIEYVTAIGERAWSPLDISDHLPLFVEFDFSK